MALGDVTMFLSLFFGTGATLWAVLLILDLLFPRRVAASAQLVERAPGRSFGFGLLLAGVGIALSLGLLNGAGPLKLLGIILVGFLGVVASLGSAGIARIVAARVAERTGGRGFGGHLAFGDMKTGAALMIAASMLPVVGWFFFFPVLFILSIGVGVQALRKPAPALEPLREGISYETS
jgi:hypothetical protein